MSKENVEMYQGLILKKKTLYAEIDILKKEYGRLGKQNLEINKAQNDIVEEVKKKLELAQEIADKLLSLEYESLSKLK